MQCMSCATELLHPANFCPVCGARLSAPAPDGSAATVPGGTTPTVVTAPPESAGAATGENVVYLTEEHGIQPGPPSGVVPPNPRAGQYEGVEVASSEPPPTPAGPTPVPAGAGAPPAAPPPHGIVPRPDQLVPPERDPDNPYGDFFSDGPSAWLEDTDEDSDVPLDRPRIVGTLLACCAIGTMLGAWVVWGIAMYRGFGGAEAAPLLLVSMLCWLRYLALPRSRQHAFLLRRHAGLQRLVERRTSPLRERTEGTLSMRRERTRYRSMRDERTRRVAALGEAAYREFRQGRLPQALHQGAQRVLAMERQMLIQDHRIQMLQLERQRSKQGGQRGAEGASPPRGSGQPNGD